MKRANLIAPALLLLAAVAVGVAVLQKAPLAGDAPDPEKPEAEKVGEKDLLKKVGYGIGVQVGRNFRRIHAGFDQKEFLRGFKDGYNRRKVAMSEDDREKMLGEFFRAKYKNLAENNAKEGKAFLAANRKKKGVVETRSGLQYIILKEGKGETPKATDTVTVQYVGTVIDGQVFDSSYRRGQAARFQVGRVIPGWTEGLQLMKVGAKYKFFIGGKLAYGMRPPQQQQLITPNALLIFEVELVSIVK